MNTKYLKPLYKDNEIQIFNDLKYVIFDSVKNDNEWKRIKSIYIKYKNFLVKVTKSKMLVLNNVLMITVFSIWKNNSGRRLSEKYLILSERTSTLETDSICNRILYESINKNLVNDIKEFINLQLTKKLME